MLCLLKNPSGPGGGVLARGSDPMEPRKCWEQMDREGSWLDGQIAETYLQVFEDGIVHRNILPGSVSSILAVVLLLVV